MSLSGKRVALLVDDLYNVHEFWYPYFRLREAQAEVSVVSRLEHHKCKLGYETPKRDLAPTEAKAGDFDAVVIPGGFAPDRMRREKELLRFVRELNDAGKVVAFICHAGWVPISAGILEGRTATSVSAIADDMKNAGAEWVDREVVVDGNLISSRTPTDLPAFCRAIIEALS